VPLFHQCFERSVKGQFTRLCGDGSRTWRLRRTSNGNRGNHSKPFGAASSKRRGPAGIARVHYPQSFSSMCTALSSSGPELRSELVFPLVLLLLIRRLQTTKKALLCPLHCFMSHSEKLHLLIAVHSCTLHADESESQMSERQAWVCSVSLTVTTSVRDSLSARSWQARPEPSFRGYRIRDWGSGGVHSLVLLTVGFD